MSNSQRKWDFGATSADDGGGGGGGDEHVQQQSRAAYELNMINCYKQCEYFFSIFKSIHFKVLIAYWMMAGYLGDRARSVEEAYEKGLVRLIDLVYKEKVLKLSDNDPGMIEFAGSSTDANCRHRGSCLGTEDSWVRYQFAQMLYWLGEIGQVMLSKDEMLSLNKKLSSSAFRYAPYRELELKKYFAVFNPMPDSLKPLLQNVKYPSVLLLRGFGELSLQSDCFPLDKLRSLTILEISGSTRLTTIPENTISQLIHLQCLNLSDLPIEALPSSFFRSLSRLRWLILRRCCQLWTLELDFEGLMLTVLDLSHCTALQNLVCSDINRFWSLRVLDLSYTPFKPSQLISSNDRLSHLYLKCSKLEDLSSLKQPQYICVLDLSGCSCFTKLDEVLLNEMSLLVKLDLSWTKVNHLPSLAKLTSLHELSLKGLDLDSLETLSSLPNQLVELDLSSLKLSSLQELKLDFLQSLKSLQVLNLSQTLVAKLPDMSKLVRLKELLLADCQHLKVLPDLQALTNLETLDLSLPNDSSSDNRQLEIESEGQRGSFPVPKSLRKLLLTNRSGINKLFPVTTLGNLNLEFLGLRGTDVIGWDNKLEAQQPQERIFKPVEIHIVSPDNDYNGRQPNQPSSSDDVEKVFTMWNALISDIQKTLNSANAQEQVVMLHNDLRYIQENFDRLKSSSNWKKSKELLRKLMDDATNTSTASFVVDSSNFKQLLQIIVKLKLLVPRKQIDDSKALEVIKKKEKTLLKRSQSKEDVNITDIVKGMQGMEPSLLNSYKSLSTIQRDCLLCFSIFPYNEDRDNNKGVFKNLVIKKKILIYWWVGEGFIDPRHEENVDPEPTLNQNPNPDLNTNTNLDLELMMSREIEAGRDEAIEQFAATKGVKKPKTIEEIGQQILKVLAEKGFIEPVMKKGRESGSYCIHPFVHSFVIERAKEEGFFDFDQESGKLAPRFTRSRRACLLQPQGSVPSSCNLWTNYISSPNKLKRFKIVKTLFNVNESMIDIKQEWFSKMKNLSVLHLGIWHSENTDLIEVNDQKFMVDLNKMKQLRLLSLQGLPTIMKLPDSVCYLSKLIILDLK